MPAGLRILLSALLVTLLGLAPLPASAQKGQTAPPAPAREDEGSEVRGDLVEAFLATLPARFQVEGTNPDGTTYFGTAEISFDWDTLTATFVWQIAGDTFRGEGPLDRGSLIIDWGQDEPAIYTVNPDLTLSGSWADGLGSELMIALP